MTQARASSLHSEKSSEKKSSATSKDKEKSYSSELEVETEAETSPPSVQRAHESINASSDNSTSIMNLLNTPSGNVSTVERLHCELSGI